MSCAVPGNIARMNAKVRLEHVRAERVVGTEPVVCVQRPIIQHDSYDIDDESEYTCTCVRDKI